MRSFDLTKPVRITNATANVDYYYGVYESVQEATEKVPLEVRKPGKTVGVNVGGLVVEYWWNNKDDLSDGGLVQKFPSSLFVADPDYRILKSVQFYTSGEFPNQFVNADTNLENPLVWEYKGSEYTVSSPLSFPVVVDTTIYERWDAICLTPNGTVEYVKGQQMFIGDSILLPWIPSDYYLLSYVHWNEYPIVIDPRSVKKTSDLINDGEDGINPFISFYDFYRENTLISGSIVHVEDYEYMVWVQEFIINNRYYNQFIRTKIDLDPGHPSFDRIDVIVLNSDLTISSIQGIPASNPVKPSITEEQLEIAFVLVKAGTTKPSDIENTLIYDENTQHSGGEANTTANSGRVDLASSEESYKGNVSIKFDQPVSGDSVTFNLLNPINKEEVDSLVFHVKVTQSDKQFFRVGFFSGAGINLRGFVEITSGRYGFNSSTVNEWQMISIPISDFQLGTVDYTRLVIVVDHGVQAVFFDYIYIQSGIDVNTNTCCELDDAPEDNNIYGRINKTWAKIVDFAGQLIKVVSSKGTGFRLRGFDPNKYGEIGNNAIDFSLNTKEGDYGALGEDSVAFGKNVKAQGKGSMVFGTDLTVPQNKTYVFGNGLQGEVTNNNSGSNLIVSDSANKIFNNLYGVLASMDKSEVGTEGATLNQAVVYQSLMVGKHSKMYAGIGSGIIGVGILNGAFGCTVVGVANEDITQNIATARTEEFNLPNPRFVVGVGSINVDSGKQEVRKNGFVVLSDGSVIAPQQTINLIEQIGAKALATKEYVDSQGGGGGGQGDMYKVTYDPTGVNADAFDFNNMHNTPPVGISEAPLGDPYIRQDENWKKLIDVDLQPYDTNLLSIYNTAAGN